MQMPKLKRQCESAKGGTMTMNGSAMRMALLAGVSILPVLLSAGVAQAQEATATKSAGVEEVVITARHRDENVQNIAAAVSVLGGELLTKTNTTTITQLTEMIPSVQFSSYNPRNSQINIRGFGSAANLANDGLEPGAGFYVDQVYYARPASATFDLIDIQRVEVLRGPQGTLYGKNSTAGAVTITTAAPTFAPHASIELTGGDYHFGQGKISVSGPIVADKLAGRLAVSYTTRDGMITNVQDGSKDNSNRNAMIRGQLLFQPNDAFNVRLVGDYAKQNTNCCTLLLSEIVTPSNGSNFVAIAKTQGYTAVADPFARKSNTNTEIHARQESGGVSSIAEWKLAKATITSVTAWRYWKWDPANDLDSTPLDSIRKSGIQDDQNQYSQELRIASSGGTKLDYVAGLYYFRESLKNHNTTAYGANAMYMYVSPLLPAAVLTGVQSDGYANIRTTSYAAFGQATWHAAPKWDVTLGLRSNNDKKEGDYRGYVSGGAALTSPPFPAFLLPTMIAVRAGFASNLAYSAASKDNNISGQVGLSYQATSDLLVYANAARGFKTGGLNFGQLPAVVPKVVKPEQMDSIEAGFKSRLQDSRVTLNVAVFQETATDYQANITDPVLLKSYISNVPEVRSRGVELDLAARPSQQLTIYGSAAYTDAIYTDFPGSPCGLENITKPYCSLTGGQVAGVPKWAASLGGEYTHPTTVGASPAELFLGLDASYRSKVGSTGNSRYTEMPGREIINARLGLRSPKGWSAYIWSKNLLDKDYLATKVANGNYGALFSTLGDPRTVGATVRMTY